MKSARRTIKLVVSDLAGTVVDFGSCAPAGALTELFSRNGITVTDAQCRKPMGMNKRDHIREMTRMPGVVEQCLERLGKQPDEAFIDDLYRAFIPLQLELLPNYSEIIDGAAEAFEAIRTMGIGIAFTTGYDKAMTAVTLEALARQGLAPDAAFCAEDVPMGRPRPWMIFRAMERLDAFPPSSVLNVGDTPADIRSGLNAGAVSVGVYASGNTIGMSRENFFKLPESERDALCELGKKTMLESGARHVIPSVDKLPELIDALE